MSQRNEHLFQFTGQQIADAAGQEAVYHDDRHTHWRGRAEAALERVEASISAKVVRRPVSGGEQVDVVVDYGDPEAWAEYRLAVGKADSHAEDRDRYLEDQTTYGTQPLRSYDLDRDDVRHYHLGGEPRED